MRVPCGHCEDCFNKKASKNSMLLQLEAEKTPYTYFVTLTYDMDSIPVAHFNYKHIPNSDKVLCTLVNQTHRLSDDYQFNIIDKKEITVDELDKILHTFHANKYRYFEEGLFPYASAADVQRFIKRLRFFIETFDYFGPVGSVNTSIRYFVCSEYGPKSFRPHYHLLLFIQSKAVQRFIGLFVRKAWKYGRIDCQPSKGGCANYCSTYVSANSLLSPLHQFSKIRPKSLHSHHLGQEPDKCLNEGSQSLQYAVLRERSVISGQRLTRVSPSVSVQTALFPKCHGYGDATRLQRRNRYTFLATVQREFGEGKTLREYADLVDKKCQSPLSLTFPFWDVCNCVSSDSTLYSILCTSSLFLKNARLFELTPDEYLDKIEKYYSDKELDLLNKWYAYREKNPLPDPLSFIYEYDNIDTSDHYYFDLARYVYSGTHIRLVPDSDAWRHFKMIVSFAEQLGTTALEVLNRFKNINNLEENKELAFCATKAKQRFDDNIKHKKLNDANNIFVYKEK